jgi:hypothetical protein
MPPSAIDLVRARKVLGRDDRRRRRAVERRRAGDDAGHAGDLGGHHRHVRGGDQGIFAAGNVAADRVHGYVLVAENDAGKRLDLDIPERVPLDLREIAHLRLGEFDILEITIGQLRETGFDLVFFQAIAFAIPLVELDGEFAHGRVSAFRNVGERLFHHGADSRVLFRDQFDIPPRLQNLCHHSLRPASYRRSACSAPPFQKTKSSYSTKIFFSILNIFF